MTARLFLAAASVVAILGAFWPFQMLLLVAWVAGFVWLLCVGAFIAAIVLTLHAGAMGLWDWWWAKRGRAL
jgi:hypothetical protein